ASLMGLQRMCVSIGEAPRFESPKHRPTRLAKPGEVVELPAGGFDDMDVVAKPTWTYSRRPPDGRPRTQPGPAWMSRTTLRGCPLLPPGSRAWLGSTGRGGRLRRRAGCGGRSR